MFVPLPPDEIAVGLDLGAALLLEAAFDIGPSQEHDEQILVHRFVGAHPKVAQPKRVLQLEVAHFA